MKTELDFLIEEAKKEEKYFKNYKLYAKKIKKVAEEILGKVKVFVFGSILRKKEIAQDIDVLIISDKVKTAEDKSKVRLKIQKKLGFLAPFEIHLVTPKEYENWYKFFIEKRSK